MCKKGEKQEVYLCVLSICLKTQSGGMQKKLIKVVTCWGRLGVLMAGTDIY